MKLPQLVKRALFGLCLAAFCAPLFAASVPPATISQAKSRMIGKWGVKAATASKSWDGVWEVTGDGLIYDLTDGEKKLMGDSEFLSTSRLLLALPGSGEPGATVLMSVTFGDTITLEDRANRVTFKLGPPPNAEEQRVLGAAARTEREKKAVTNNLRQLAAAADQYYLENGVSMVSADKLIGPTNYVKSITPVVGEDYSRMLFVQGQTIYVKARDGRVFSYDP